MVRTCKWTRGDELLKTGKVDVGRGKDEEGKEGLRKTEDNGGIGKRNVSRYQDPTLFNAGKRAGR